jgi:hypothetical protein
MMRGRDFRVSLADAGFWPFAARGNRYYLASPRRILKSWNRTISARGLTESVSLDSDWASRFRKNKIGR